MYDLMSRGEQAHHAAWWIGADRGSNPGSLNHRMGAVEEWGPAIRSRAAATCNITKRNAFSAESELNISAAL